MKAGLVAVGSEAKSSYVFSIPEDITTTVVNGVAQFGTDAEPIEIFQGTFARTSFNVDNSLDQRFIIANPDLDYSTLVVRIKDPNDVGLGKVWERVENIIRIDANSEVYFLAEVNQENYELLFGDNIFGKALQNSQVIESTYIITKGKEGDGAANFTFSGSLVNDNGAIIAPSNIITINTLESARNGADIETVDSIKYYAPRVYGAQYRAVTGRDYEGIIKSIYPNTESVSVVGGEELVPPQFGNVLISIKPVNGIDVSDFDKKQILDGLKQYTIAGINQKIVDLKILFVEIDSSVYYDITKVGNSNTSENQCYAVTQLIFNF